MTEARARREEEELRKRIIREAVDAAIADFRVALEKMLQPLDRKSRRRGSSKHPKALVSK